MEINTKAYGMVEINEDEILTFINGIVGFEDMKKFILLKNQSNSPLVWLQSLDDENLAFVVIDPREFKPNYQPEINISELEDMDIKEDSPLEIYSIVVIPNEINKMTANLRAPIVINRENQKAKQIILNDDTYKVKEYILQG